MSNTYTPPNMDPMLQMYLQYLLQGGSGIVESAPAWQGSADPSLLGGLSFGYDETPQQGQTFAGMIPPSQDPEDAGSLEEAQRQGNYFQDVIDMTADPVAAAMFGGGGFSADAFAPTVQRELIPRPHTQRFQRWLQDPDSFEGMVAQAVQNGRSPRSAIIDMREVIENADKDLKDHPDSPDQQLQQEAARFARMLPTKDETTTFDGAPLNLSQQVRWQEAFDSADTLVQPYFDEQETQPGPIGEVRDAQGNLISSGGNIVEEPDANGIMQLYRETTTDSPLAEKYHELGIPLPTEQYDAGDFLGPQWQQAEESYINNIPSMDDAYRQIEQDRNRALENATGNNLSQSDVFRMDSMDNAVSRAPSTPPTPGVNDSTGGTGPAPTTSNDTGIVGSWEALLGGTGQNASAIAEGGGLPWTGGVTPVALGAGLGKLHDWWDVGWQNAGDYAGRPAVSTVLGDPSGTNPYVGAVADTAVDAAALDAQRVNAGRNWLAEMIGGWGQAAQAGGGNAIDAAGGFDPLGTIADTTGNWWSNWTGANQQPSGQAAGGQQFSPGGSQDPFAGMTLEQQQAATAANPVMQTPAWQAILAQSMGQGAAPQTPAPTGNQIAAGPGIGGGGAGGQGSPRTIEDLIGQGQPGVPPGGYVHNGAIFDANDRLVGYVDQQPPDWQNQAPALQSPAWQQLLQASRNKTGAYQQNQMPVDANTLAAMQGTAPQPPRPSSSPRTGPEPSEGAPTQPPPQSQVLGIGDWMSQMVLGHRPAAAPTPTPRAPTDANTLAMLQQMLTPTQVFENQRQAQFAQPQTSNASTRTGPEPSEGAPRGRRQNASGRTGPEPSEAAAAVRPGAPLQLWNQGDKTPDQATAMQMLRFMLGGRGEDRGGGGGDKRTRGSGVSGKQKLYFGSHPASAVDTYRLTEKGKVRGYDRAGAEARVRENREYNSLYGRDYWQARGYAEALQAMGVNPTSVAMANRTGGLNRVMGRR